MSSEILLSNNAALGFRISMLVFLGAPSLLRPALAQPFGRFGYVSPPAVSGFVLDNAGFRVNAKGSSEFRYTAPTTQWRPTDLSDMGVTAIVSTHGLTPRKLKVNLLSSGFSLFFETGFSFTLSSQECPFLSWSDGSVGPDVPTPETGWILVSFKKSESPVLLAFPEGKCAVRVGGTAGNWTVRSVDVGPHWVKVVAPLGIDSAATSSAADLGSLIRKITPNLDVWASADPQFKSLDTRVDAVSVTATWHFDHPGAIVPRAVVFARDAGDPIEIQTPIKDLGVITEDGPTQACTGQDLTIRFPVLALPSGRNLAVGVPKIHLDPPARIDDWQAVLRLALGQWSCGSDKRTRDAANDYAGRFISECQDVAEPFTGQKLPYSPDGKGLDTAAAYAALAGAVNAADGQTGQPNPLLLSIMLRRDWATWELWTDDAEVRRVATALASVACVAQAPPYGRLNGAMLEAGMCAEKAVNLWRSRHGLGAPPKADDTLQGLLSGFFLQGPEPHPFAESLVGPIQVASDLSLSAQMDPGKVTLQWFEQDLNERVIVIRSAAKLTISAGKNIDSFSVDRKAGAYVVHASPKDTGPTSIILKSAEPIELPTYAPPPLL